MHIDWDLLTRYLAGTCPSEEREELEQWLAEAPEHRAVMEGARAMVTQARRAVPAERSAELLASLRRDIAGAEASGTRPPALRVVHGGDRDRPPITFPRSAWRPHWTGRIKAAAAVLLLAGGTIVWATMSPVAHVRRASSTAAYRDIVAARGQRIAFRLPDGSAVTLAPGSRLRVPNDYGSRDRTVALVGEAAFTVTHNAARPFAVQTARGVAKDLGTRFVVHEYEGDSSTVVVVAEGVVELRGQRDRDGSATPLTRGQLGRVGASGTVTVRSGVDLDPYFAWTEGRLVFHEVPLGEVAAQLARWYDVDVRLESDALAAQRLTASTRDEPAGDVLQMIAVSLNLQLEISQAGRVYTLRAR